MQQTEIRYELLKLIEKDPTLDQRGLAKSMGVSLGRTNYCMKALVERGYVKATNFKRSNNKARYLYALTPEGIEAKYQLTVEFLASKRQEYENLKAEIEALNQEVASQDQTRAGEAG